MRKKKVESEREEKKEENKSSQLGKVLIMNEILFHYPFGESICQKLSGARITAYARRTKKNKLSVEDMIYGWERTTYKSMTSFYSLLFNGFAIRPFKPIKTKIEKELRHKYIPIKYGDRVNKINTGVALANIITKRFFKDNPHLLNRDEIVSEFFSDYVNERIENLGVKYEKEVNAELFENAEEEKEMIQKKLKRNVLSEKARELYKKIINEIAKDDVNEHKSNMQKICNDIAAKNNITTDLRKAFEQWKNRNIVLYKKLLEDAKQKLNKI